MIFSELYSAYYRSVGEIISACLHGHPDEKDLRKIVEQHAFSESALTVLPALKEERWQLLRKDFSTPIRHDPSLPLTQLEKRWLKAVLQDPRVKLFDARTCGLEETEPLFDLNDIRWYDRYADGDPYEDEDYIQRFRMVLEAIRAGKPLQAELINRKKKPVRMRFIPTELEYSEKDDKFRLISTGSRLGETINVGRILKCKPSNRPFEWREPEEPSPRKKTVEFELTDRRNSLERALLHFAHFEKEAERIGDDRYRIRVTYDRQDETEMVIRILSFGPVIKVISPESFVDLIKERLLMQKSCGQ